MTGESMHSSMSSTTAAVPVWQRRMGYSVHVQLVKVQASACQHRRACWVVLAL